MIRHSRQWSPYEQWRYYYFWLCACLCFNSFLDSFSRSQLRFITLFLLGRCTALNMIILLILIDHFAFGQKCPALTCRSRFTLYPPSAQKKNPVEYVQGLAHNHLVMISCNDLLRFGYFVLFRSFPAVSFRWLLWFESFRLRAHQSIQQFWSFKVV